MRRSSVIAASVATACVVLSAFGACGGDREDASAPPVDGGSGVDATLAVDATPPEPALEPEPGDVCGDGSGLEASATWPLRGGCATRAGWSSSPGPQTADVQWIAAAPAGESSPAVSASALTWVGTTAGDVLALGPSGVARWAHHTGGAVRSSPALDVSGNAVIGSSDGTLYALAAGEAGSDADGGADAGQVPPARIVFALPLGPIASSPVIGADGTIYVTTTTGKLFAVADDGSGTRWSVTTNDTLGSSPAIGQDGTIYVGSSDRQLYAIAPDGTTKWAVDLGAEIDASPSVGGDGAIYLGTVDGRLHAFGPDGDERWSYATGGPIRSAPAVYAGAVYVGSEDQKLHAISTLDGSRRWTYETRGAVSTPVIGPDGVVYFGSTDARVYAVSAKGNLVFAVNAKGKVTSAPAVGVGPALYVSTDTGVIAIGP